jgi:hypothetical protein
MKSVRMLAAGAVALFALCLLTAPVRACDDRFIKKCETESEAAFVAEQAAAAPPAVKRRSLRVRAAATEKPVRTRAPRFIARTKPAAPGPTLASDEERPAALAETPLARRFRGFIDPHPMTVNSFEDLRKPRLDTEHLTPAATLPMEDAVAGPDENVTGVEVPTAAVVAEAVPVPPQAAAAPVAVAGTPAPAFAQTIETASDSGKPGSFPFHKLVLTLCGALGVASALRFIVRA